MRYGLVVVAALAAAAPAHADAPAGAGGGAAPSGPAVTAAISPPADADRRGLAVGLEVGEPASVTVGWWAGRFGVSGALGTGTRAGLGVSAHVDLQLEVARVGPTVPIRVGLGGRYYHHGYEPMSLDELPDAHYGIRASAAIALERGPLELYAEAAPGVDLRRTASCSLARGPDSICPHAQAAPLFLQLVLGARWFFSN